MKQPKVSVVVPIYNVEPYLVMCLESLLNQTLKEIEIILVDDGSPDNCPQICDEYAQRDSRIKVIHKKNAGLGMARNSGIEIATGKYIAFLDSDDIWLPNKLSDQLKVFEKSEVAIVFSNYEKVSLGGERCGREVIAPCEVDYPLLLKGNCIGCLTAMYDSALTGKIFFKEIGHEDYVCWLSILKQGYKARNTNTVTALYRVGDHSVSSNKLKAMRWQWNILRNEMDLPVYKAVYYFIHYAIRAFAKAMR